MTTLFDAQLQALADAAIDAYGDPLFLRVPVATVLLSMVAFLAFAAPLTWLAARDPAWARRWKLLGAHVALLWTWIAFRQWEAAEGHAGSDLPWTPTHWLPGSHGALHRDFHRARVRGNHAGFLPVWDRVFGTLVRDYDRALQDWKARA